MVPMVGSAVNATSSGRKQRYQPRYERKRKMGRHSPHNNDSHVRGRTMVAVRDKIPQPTDVTGFRIGSAAGSSPGFLKDGTIDIQCTSSLGPIPICCRIDIQACIIASTFDSHKRVVQLAWDKLTDSNVIVRRTKTHPHPMASSSIVLT